MIGKDIVWSREIKDFAAYCFGYSGISQQAASYLWDKHMSTQPLCPASCSCIMYRNRKTYTDIVKLLQRMTQYFGHDYFKDFVDIMKNEYGAEVTA